MTLAWESSVTSNIESASIVISQCKNFMVRVRGNSMIDAGIQSGDLLKNYSIDESFLQLPIEHSLAVAADMKAKAKKWTGIPVSVGLGPTKTLAKLANHLAKKRPDAVYELTPNHEMLDEVEVCEIWGIGSASEKKLLEAGIKTVASLRDADDWWVQKALSTVGLRLVHELRGIPCLPLKLVRPPKKGMCVSWSFGAPVTTVEGMKQAVATYAARMGEKLRSHESFAAAITVFMHTNPFKNEPRYSRCLSLRLPVPSAAGNELIRWSSVLVKRLFCDGYRYKKAGILVTEIVSNNARQGNLLY